MSTCFSKKLTSDCSVKSDARMCSREIDQPPSATLSEGESFWGVLVDSNTESCSQAPAEASACGSSGNSSELLPELLLLCPTSPICSSRVVTVAMAWYKSFSSGSSWNILYKVLQNWMNSL
uniref:Uncharacterized protein n=1 Tax=Ornithorhynchus anatinus TaxID=9258 RepID=A0A6I8N9J7_ORNAN